MLDEPGGYEVEAALGAGAGMSAVNWAEALSASADAGIEPESVEDDLTRAGIFGEALTIIPLDAADGSLAARLRPLTRRRGLSLADRACLALAIRMDRPVLIADPAWADLRLGVEVRLIRP